MNNLSINYLSSEIDLYQVLLLKPTLNSGKRVFLIKLSPKAIYALYKKNVLLRKITYKKK